MKKLSSLIALCMLISIGGVYATWVYTGTTADKVDQTITHGIAGAQTTGSAGTITITENNVAITVDQADALFNAELLITGSIQLQFVVKPGAPSNIMDTLNARINLRNIDQEASKYLDKNGVKHPVYALNNNGFIDVVWTLTGENTYTATISAADIAAVLVLGGEFQAPTHLAWQDLHDAEENIGIDIVVENIT